MRPTRITSLKQQPGKDLLQYGVGELTHTMLRHGLIDELRLSIQHKGYVNGTAALDHLAATFPRATEVVVMGESAGSVATPLYAGLVSDRLPDARITVLANGSCSHPDLPDINRRLAAAWGTGNAIPPWPENAGLTAGQWTSFPGLFVQSGRLRRLITSEERSGGRAGLTPTSSQRTRSNVCFEPAHIAPRPVFATEQ
jgi:hypothetical protein